MKCLDLYSLLSNVHLRANSENKKSQFIRLQVNQNNFRPIALVDYESSRLQFVYQEKKCISKP